MEKVKILVLLVLFIAILIFINKLLENQNDFAVTDTANVVNNYYENSYLEVEEENMSNTVLEVTSENFEEEVLKANQTVLVDFYADWCGPCQMLSPIVEEVAEEIKDVKFVRLNIDNAEKIAMDYGVMSIPTLVVIKNGKEENRSVGLISKVQVLELIK